MYFRSLSGSTQDALLYQSMQKTHELLSSDRVESKIQVYGTADPVGAIGRTCALLRGIVAGLVEYPEDLVVEAFEDGERTKLILQVRADDLERVTGPRGRTAKSLRVLVSALAREQQAVSLEIRALSR